MQALRWKKDMCGISGGVNQSTLMGSNFTTKPGNGFAGGLSVRGNYYNNWSMIYGMQFFVNKFSLESNLKQDIEYSLSGVQIRLLMSYNVIKDHISIDFGPILQVNGKMYIDNSNENKILEENTAISSHVYSEFHYYYIV